MNCIIVEDQRPAQRILEHYIGQCPNVTLVGMFSNALEALDFLNASEVDLIFLDIDLPKLSGIDFLKTLQQPPQIILTTAFPNYALESYELNVTDYLLKPFSFPRFLKAIAKLRGRPQLMPSPAPTPKSLFKTDIFIKSGYELVKVGIADIRYIQSDTDYTEVVTQNAKHLSQEPLKYWAKELSSSHFMRIHKSYILNLDHLDKVVGNQVILDNAVTLPIGRTYKEDFMARILGGS